MKKLGLMGIEIGIEVLSLKNSYDPEEFVKKCVSTSDLIIAGIPARMLQNLTICSIALAYTYTIEDELLNDRIKNHNLRFIANLLGARQVADVIKEIDRVEKVIIVGPPEQVKKAALTIAEICGGEVETIEECSGDSLWSITSKRIERLSK
ncbi:MAG: hypothetical protein F7C36_00455 [Desulfurococcales archaeon]|nr:hypothetical protein [Desulfurococcales archaeon]